nr:sulfotransferase [Ardenticatena sp.]
MTSPLIFNRLANWIRLLQQSPTIEKRYWPRVAQSLALASMTEPLRVWERRRYGPRIAATDLHPEPIIIVGQARSGTTHLHNLLSLDPRYGYISTLQALIPTFINTAGPVFERLLPRLLPATRPMDNVAVRLDAPQEDEVALANVSVHSVIYQLVVPRWGQRLFRKYTLMDDITPQEFDEWRDAWFYVLKTATFLHSGKPLVLKTPPHTGRALHLLRLFPKARFVHIYRNPHRVFRSMRHMFQKIMPPAWWHCLDDNDLERQILESYAQVMQRWYRDMPQIDPARVIEMSYERLVAEPIETLKAIYQHLGLDPAPVLPRWEAYLQQLGAYKTNQFTPNERDRLLVERHLGFLLDRWGYREEGVQR